MRRLGILAASAAAALAVGCTDPMVTGEITPGVWGGAGMLMAVADTGASVQFNCASGWVSAPLTVTGGHFTWNGSYKRVFGAPGAPPDSAHPATYTGTASDNRINVVVDVPDLQLQAADVELVLGRSAQLALCP
jgi:hypothetical protein